jgi:DNA-binding response OmpR family regulator
MLDGHGQRILTIDTDRTVLELLQIRLELAGYRAHLARNSATGLDLLKHLRPAAIVVDSRLDQMDGFEMIRTVRYRHPELSSVPILLIGRSLTVDDVRRALGYGAQSAMLKPFSGAEVVERIGRLLTMKPSVAPQAVATPQPAPAEAAAPAREEMFL